MFTGRTRKAVSLTIVDLHSGGWPSGPWTCTHVTVRFGVKRP
jgi:hypothetical protein